MKVIAAIEDAEVIYRSAEPLDWLGALSHAEGLAPKPRAPPRSVLSGPVSPASVGSRELICEPVYDDLPCPDPA